MKRSSAAAHAKRRHVCPRCQKVCRGNGYAHHRAACERREIIRYAEAKFKQFQRHEVVFTALLESSS